MHSVDTREVRRAAIAGTTPDALAEALQRELGGVDVAMTMAFVSPDIDERGLAAALRRHCPDLPLLACTTAGLIGPGGYGQSGITGFCLHKSAFRAAWAGIADVAQFGMEDARQLAEDLMQRLQQAGGEPLPENTFALLLIDGMSMCEERVASALSAALGDIAIVGGSAGDGLRFRSTAVFCDGEFRHGGAAVALIHTELPFTVFKTEHFAPGEQKMVVTGADVATRLVTELNGEVAASEYARLVGSDPDALTPEVFAAHPVVVGVGGSHYVRSIQRVEPDGSLKFFCAIDEGLVLTMARGLDLVGDLRQTLRAVERRIGRTQLLVGFDCILRRLELDRIGAAAEVGGLLDAHQAVGFSTYGEQYRSMHVTQTLTGVAIGVRP